MDSGDVVSGIHKEIDMKKIFVLYLIAIFIGAVTLHACSDDDKTVQITGLKMNYQSVSLKQGDHLQLTAIPRPADAPVCVKWTSSDPTIASVDDRGNVTAINDCGRAVITARVGSYFCKCTVTLISSTPQDFASALGSVDLEKIIYSRDVQLPATRRIMQGFDIAKSGKMYYSQISAGAGTSTYVSMATGPGEMAEQKYMDCRYFGHGTQIVAEEAADGKTYIWLNSNGNMETGGEYGTNLSVSRVEFVPGAVHESYAGRTFFLNKNGEYDQQVSIDFEHRRLLIGSRKSARYFWIFDLDEVLALPEKDMKITTNVEGVTSEKTVRGCDLNDCRVLGHFTVNGGSNKETDVYSYSHQGHAIYGDYVYFYEGNAITLGTDNFTCKAYVTVFDYSGNIAVPRTEVKVLSATDAWKSLGLTTTGWCEPEGLKVDADGIYLGVASRDGDSSPRRANILFYRSSNP